MTTYGSPEAIINQVKRIVESDRRSEIRLNANGGNSILLVCPPEQEAVFIAKIKEMLSQAEYAVINLDEVLVTFIEKAAPLSDLFDLLRGSLHQIFKTPEGEQSNDLFSLILTLIAETFAANKVPVLIRAGALYGTGIDNLHLMENELVMNSKKPLIILYPATKEGDKLMFLNSRPASRYRCLIVEN